MAARDIQIKIMINLSPKVDLWYAEIIDRVANIKTLYSRAVCLDKTLGRYTTMYNK